MEHIQTNAPLLSQGADAHSPESRNAQGHDITMGSVWWENRRFIDLNKDIRCTLTPPPPPRLHLHRPVYFYSTWMASDEISPTIQHMSFRLGILNIKTGANLTSLVNGRREQPEIKAIRLGLLFAEVKTKRRHGSLYTCTAWWKCRGVHPPPPTVRPTVSEWT